MLRLPQLAALFLLLMSGCRAGESSSATSAQSPPPTPASHQPAAGQAAAEASPRLSVALDGPRKEGDRIEVVQEDGVFVLVVTSRFGIGRATITAKDGVWPARLKFRLKLKGLEGFNARRGDLSMNELKGVAVNGAFEVELPRELLHQGAQPLRVQWIDFYRG